MLFYAITFVWLKTNVHMKVVNFVIAKLRNKYLFSVLFFIVWLSFFDKNDFISQYTYRKQLTGLRAEKQYYLDEIKKNKEDFRNLMGNPANLEKFAREKYFMKKDDEDIFLIVYKEPQKKK